jgi:hypothetical protein
MALPLPNTPDVPAETRQRLEQEFATYRRELPRLLAEGHANRFALIRENQVLSIWDTQRDAIQAAVERFGTQPVTINKINPLDVDRFTQLDAAKEHACPA